MVALLGNPWSRHTATCSLITIIISYCLSCPQFGVPFFIEVGVFDFSSKTTGKKEKDLAKESSVTSAIISEDVTNNLRSKQKFPHKIMGSALFEVGEVLGSRGNAASKKLQRGGEVTVHIESSKTDGMKGKFRLKLGGIDLPNVAYSPRLKTCSPFYEILRRVERPTGDVAW